MRYPKLLILGISLFLFVCSCGGGGGGSSSTPADTNFKLYPDGYFTAGYEESYNLTGSDTAGGTHEGSYQMQTEGSELFLGTQAVAIEEIIEWTNTQTGAFVAMLGTSYYVNSASGCVLLGDITDDGITTQEVSTTTIPKYAEIGDFGSVGSYIDDDGWTEDASWRLESAGSGRANFIIYYTVRDDYGDVQVNEDHTFLIDTDGNRLRLTARAHFTEESITITLSGNRL